MAYLWTGAEEASPKSQEANLKAQRKRNKRAKALEAKAARVRMGTDKGNAKAIRRRAKPK